MTDPAAAFPLLLQRTLDYALAYLNSLDTTSVGATADLAKLRSQIDMPLSDGGIKADAVIDDLVHAVAGGLLGIPGPRFFGWVNGGAVPAALAADWLTSAWDQNASLYAVGPAASVVEETAGRWLKEILHLPASASFAFVTGCQMAHVTCLAAARHALLERCGWDVERDGLSGAPAIRVLTSTEAHGSMTRAVRLLGLGERHIHALPADQDGRLRGNALREALQAEPKRPTVVVLQAGDLNIGAYDNFAKLIPLAKEFDAWVHVDGAFGLWAAASERRRPLVRGIEQADSWSTDGHKWLNVPYDSGYAFVADAPAHRASMSHRAVYLTHDVEARDSMNWNPEWSRRARGFATYAALRELGRSGVAALVERTCAHAHAMVMRIGSLPGAEVLWEPQINQGLVRFLDWSESATEEDHDRATDRMMERIAATGIALFTGTTWRGRRAMRVSVCNWRTTEQDVEQVYCCIAQLLNNGSV